MKSENCTGDYLKNCKNTKDSFDSFQNEDIKFCSVCSDALSMHDFDVGGYKSELCYEMASSGNQNYQCAFAINYWGNCSNTFYCDIALNLKDSFGCIGLRNAQYCILNKQYSKEEYFELRKKIIEHMKKTGEWGEFFPIELSPFAYNETVAQEYFPLTKEEALAKGYKWREPEKNNVGAAIHRALKNNSPQQQSTQYKIPDTIQNTHDSITNEILTCEECGKNYKIQKAELKFYRKMNLPVPHFCPDCRHKHRMALRNPRKLWTRTCDNPECRGDDSSRPMETNKTPVKFQTTFAPDRPEKIFCETCYLEAVN